MKVRIEDKDALQALSWEALKDYLDRAKGWKYAEDIADKAVVYQHKDRGGRLREIIVPIRRDLGDYARRMADAVSTLARVEKRSELYVYEDLSRSGEAAAYKVHARIRKWLAEEGWHVRDVDDPQSSFNIMVALPDSPEVNIFQRCDHVDRLTLSEHWVYADDVRSIFGQLSSDNLQDVVWKIYRDVSTMGMDFTGLDTPTTEMTLRTYIYFDGLTKDVLVQRILLTIRSIMLAGRTFLHALEVQSRLAQQALSDEDRAKILQIVPRTESHLKAAS
jgi:hypothetical protein